ncbi:MAG: molecular chaperone HtpG [Planctomycetota bacterium]|nr:molecular chaperone HtpG [Planctomycetota bacterium]
MPTSTQTHPFQAEVHQVLSLVINSLYSHKEIFLRELVSNASDALDRLQFRSLTDHELMGDQSDLEIQIIPDRDAGTLKIVDTGDGMTAEDLQKNLGTVAHSGTQRFVEALQEKDEVALIGQFGVGFYSAFLVADRVTVTSRACGPESVAMTWESDGRTDYTLCESDQTARGTEVCLHLKEEHLEFLEEHRLRGLVRKYSDYVSHSIRLQVEDRDEEGNPKTGEDRFRLETINKANALWARPKAEIEEDQYREFYKHLTNDWEDPLTWLHFQVEGTLMYSSLLYIPKRAPMDIDWHERQGVRLFVKRVFIKDDCNELLPEYLRFVRGVVDSDDLPLNVSREMLQQDRVVRTMKKQLVKRILDHLQTLSQDQPEEYNAFWKTFGNILKAGVHLEPENRDRIARLLRYPTTHGEGTTSLQAYIERMKEGQESIYYLTGPSLASLTSSPHIEALRDQGYEVIFMTDPVDEWVVESLREFEETPLVSAAKGNIDLDRSNEEQQLLDEQKESLKPLLERSQKVLDTWVSEVRISERLKTSPACLVADPTAMSANLERILQAGGHAVTPQKRILELNPNHKVVEKLLAILAGSEKRAGIVLPDGSETSGGGDGESVDRWIELLYDQSLMAEGSPVRHPDQFARQITDLLEREVERRVEGD